MSEGWIKLHRDIFTHWIFEDVEYFRAWLFIVGNAAFDDTKQKVGNKIVTVKRGEFVVSERRLCELFTWSKSKLRNFFDILISENMLKKEIINKKTKLIIVNYEVFQNQETKKEPEKNQETTEKEPRKDQEKTKKRAEKDQKETTKEECKEDKEINNISKEILPNPSPDKNKNTPYQEIVNLFNTTCTSLPKARELSAKRKEKIKVRFKEKPNLNFWSEIFKKVESSDFLCGRSGSWKCGFDWIFKNNENYIKIMEGNYDNKGTSEPAKSRGYPQYKLPDIYDPEQYIQTGDITQEEYERQLSELRKESEADRCKNA